MRSSLFFSSLLWTLGSLHANTTTKHTTPPVDPPMPWLTGPLLTPAAHTIPSGHYNIEPYEYVTTNYGVYNKHWNGVSTPHNVYNVITQTIIQVGIPAQFDVFVAPQWEWNHTHSASHWALNDLGFGFDYQLYARGRHDWLPSFKLNVGAKAPIGKYDHLNPHLRGTDAGGTGSWMPSAGIVMSHLVYLGGKFFFSPRFNLQYTVPTPVFVRGYNVYGGGKGTRGTVFPGQSLVALFGYEFSLSQNWAIAGDIQYQHTNKTRFKGHRGSTDGIPHRLTSPSSESWSLAPAIEYNWSAYYGVIAGAWFTVAGRNTPEFASGVVAINIYH